MSKIICDKCKSEIKGKDTKYWKYYTSDNVEIVCDDCHEKDRIEATGTWGSTGWQ